VEFLPMLLFAIPAGVLVDHLPRRTVFAVALIVAGALGASLALLSGFAVTALAPYLVLATGVGVTLAVLSPVSSAMPPTLVSRDLLASAMTLSNVATRAGAVAGPAVAGVLFAVTAPLAYGVAAAACVGAAFAVLAMRSGRVPAGESDPLVEGSGRLARVLEGLVFLRATPVMLGAILLDLFGVLLGGAIALLPAFAISILHCGSTGLGLLRAAPAVGALLAAAHLTRHPMRRRIGPRLLMAVAAFGVSMVVFGLSRSYPLSLVAIGVSGLVDLYSMNIRATISALAIPDRLRGRVGAVETVFISASNELGAFESGLAATVLGIVPAVVAGGAVTVGLAVSWRWLFPALATADDPHALAVE
jgi:hypothetical protein